MLVSILSTPVLIRWLRTHNIGQQIREDGPKGHFSKAGTPTMGGLAIMGAALIGYLAAHIKAVSHTVFTERGLLAMLAMGGAALIGFADDWIKVSRQRSLGLNKRTKIAGQLLIGGAFAAACVYWQRVDTHLSFTSASPIHVSLGRIGWIIFAVVVFIACTNGVNLTDGLDGLAAGSSVFAFAAFTVIGFYQFKHPGLYRNPAALDEAALCAAMVGALAGFLWWNAAPAKIIMGDTGSLGIGAALSALALLQNVDLLLPVIGGLFVIETLSVIMQVFSFRVLHRRVFRMAPIHHHFELLGWPETTVIVRFWILAGMCTAVALGLFYTDFLAHGGIG